MDIIFTKIFEKRVFENFNDRENKDYFDFF